MFCFGEIKTKIQISESYIFTVHYFNKNTSFLFRIKFNKMQWEQYPRIGKKPFRV